MQIDNAKKELPFFSIVICTYNRKKILRDCLNSVFALEYPRSGYEIIIVDGGSTDGTEELCKEFPEIRFVIERKSGLAAARNRGANLARGSIVAYTDDDCVVDKHWLTNLVLGFRVSESIAGVGGPVCPFRPEIIPKKILVKPALGLFDEGNSAKLVTGLITGNCAFKKDIFKFAKFDESLGVNRRGKLLLSGEDTDFCSTLIDSGYKLFYEPQAKVYHQVPTERMQVRYIIKRAVHIGLSNPLFLMKRKKSRIWAIRAALSMFARYLISLIKDQSFTSCYYIVYSLSTFAASVTSMDRIFR